LGRGSPVSCLAIPTTISSTICTQLKFVFCDLPLLQSVVFYPVCYHRLDISSQSPSSSVLTPATSCSAWSAVGPTADTLVHRPSGFLFGRGSHTGTLHTVSRSSQLWHRCLPGFAHTLSAMSTSGYSFMGPCSAALVWRQPALGHGQLWQ
jgi:hypothetical protein